MRDADDHFRVFLPASKTDVFRLGVHVHLTANESDTCPIAALSAMLEDRSDDMTAESPLFQLEGAPMTRTSLLRGMKVLLLAAGLDPAKYSGHSLRKGGAQSLYDAGRGLREFSSTEIFAILHFALTRSVYGRIVRASCEYAETC